MANHPPTPVRDGGVPSKQAGQLRCRGGGYVGVLHVAARSPRTTNRKSQTRGGYMPDGTQLITLLNESFHPYFSSAPRERKKRKKKLPQENKKTKRPTPVPPATALPHPLPHCPKRPSRHAEPRLLTGRQTEAPGASAVAPCRRPDPWTPFRARSFPGGTPRGAAKQLSNDSIDGLRPARLDGRVKLLPERRGGGIFDD